MLAVTISPNSELHMHSRILHLRCISFSSPLLMSNCLLCFTEHWKKVHTWHRPRDWAIWGCAFFITLSWALGTHCQVPIDLKMNRRQPQNQMHPLKTQILHQHRGCHNLRHRYRCCDHLRSSRSNLVKSHYLSRSGTLQWQVVTSKSTLQNKIMGDLQVEFSFAPNKGEELPLEELGDALGSGFRWCWLDLFK